MFFPPHKKFFHFLLPLLPLTSGSPLFTGEERVAVKVAVVVVKIFLGGRKELLLPSSATPWQSHCHIEAESLPRLDSHSATFRQ